jgi:hypothetical protein
LIAAISEGNAAMGDMDEQECRLVELLAEMKQEGSAGSSQAHVDEGPGPAEGAGRRDAGNRRRQGPPADQAGPGEEPKSE